MESFIHPSDIGSRRRQVLLPVIEKPAAPTVLSVPVAAWSVLSVPDYNPNPKSDYNPNPSMLTRHLPRRATRAQTPMRSS